MKGSTEEERLGLVKGDSNSPPPLPSYHETFVDEHYTDDKESRYGRGITNSPPRRGSDEKSTTSDPDVVEYEAQRRRFNDSRSGSRDRETPAPPPPPGGRKHSPPRGGDGAFI